MPEGLLNPPNHPRDKVIAAALRLFTHKGYFSTSMRDITGESAVSTGSVYHYFKDKEGVAAALYQKLIDRTCRELGEVSLSHESAHDQCRAVVSYLFRTTVAEPDLMAFMLYVKHREFLPHKRPICSSEPFEMMRSMVQRGMRRGEISEGDVLVTSTCLFGGPIRMITSELDGILERPLMEYIDEVWACSWRAVAAFSTGQHRT